MVEKIQIFKKINILAFTLVVLFALIVPIDLNAQPKVQVFNDFLYPEQVQLKGLLGDEIQSSEQGRLAILPEWNGGQLIKMFSEEYRKKNKTNDWYGEHAGKWMYTTALAANRTGDQQMKNHLFSTADELISYQDDKGYLGSYAPGQRISAAEYTMHHRSWDVWNLTYMTLGFLKIYEFTPVEKYKNAALQIGELLLRTFGPDKADITGYGTRHGYSATIVLEAAVELYKVTNDKRYIDFGAFVLDRINKRPGLQFFPMMQENRSLELIGDGKIYQSIWNMYAIGKFYEINPDPSILPALQKAWQQITNFHLNPAGGPWGGYAKHLECFNSRVFFTPYGLVETCSTMSWIHFNRQMLRLTGEAKYAEEIEKSVYNELIGAKFNNGIDWSYHSFSNGCKHDANFNDCCPSSGALALEEISTLVYSLKENGIACNLYGAGAVAVNLDKAGNVKLVQETNYPFESDISITVMPQKKSEFPIFIRIPAWAKGAEVKVNNQTIASDQIREGEFLKIERKWAKNDQISLHFPFEMRVNRRVERVEVPQSKENIYAINWVSFSRGPLVYAMEGLIDGTSREKSLKINTQNLDNLFKEVESERPAFGKEFELQVQNTDAMRFVPYYRVGDRQKGIWRTTWLQTNIDY